MNRRELLLGAAAGLALPLPALGFGDASRVDVAELQLGTPVSRPNAWKRMLHEVDQTTSVEVEARVVPVRPEDPDLFEHPFTVLVGQDAFEVDEAGAEQLSRYLSYGGFLLVDEVTGTDNSPFDASVRELARQLFPGRQLAPLPRDHSIYRSFFLIDTPVGRLARFPELEGVTVGSLTPFVYTRNDLSGALDRRDTGAFAAACVPGGERQRREAMKLAINLVMYSLTANYKKDQAHVVELKKRGRLE